MWFWWFMFFSDLLIPALMAGSGRMMYRHPPKSINGLVGYRTVGVVGGILCMVQCAVLIGCIFPTERALKRNFTEDGERKV